MITFAVGDLIKTNSILSSFQLDRAKLMQIGKVLFIQSSIKLATVLSVTPCNFRPKPDPLVISNYISVIINFLW